MTTGLKGRRGHSSFSGMVLPNEEEAKRMMVKKCCALVESKLLRGFVQTIGSHGDDR